MEIGSTPTAAIGDDWTRLRRPGRRAQVGDPPVDVIVRVRAGYDETARCLHSVLAAHQQTAFGLIVVGPADPDPRLSSFLREFAAGSLFELRGADPNLGFVNACDAAMRVHPRRDVILLDSNTAVHGDWLDRLRATAHASHDIGSAAPLSSSGGIAGYPNFMTGPHGGLEISDAELDVLSARVNAGRMVDVTVSDGSCLYLRRDMLDQIGLPAEEDFDGGHGRDDDLCLRAAAAGWRNVLAANVFVRQLGGASSDAKTIGRTETTTSLLERAHPGYRAVTAAFAEQDPGRPARAALDAARIERITGGNGILIISHSWGGGVSRHVDELLGALRSEGWPAVLCRPANGGLDVSVPEGSGAFQVPNLKFSIASGRPDEFARFVNDAGLTHLHIHSLAGYHESAPDYFRLAAGLAGVRYDFTVHDYMSFCPRINLVDASGVYCGEPQQDVCTRCIAEDGSPFGTPALWDWRARYGRFLSGARRIFVPDVDVQRRMERRFPDLSFHIRPHQMLREPPKAPAGAGAAESSRRDRRVALLGRISQGKGSDVLRDVAAVAARRGLPLEFVVVGLTDRDDDLAALGNVLITGPFEEGEGPSRLAAAEADLVWFPAVSPETYSYTLSDAFEAGVFPVAFDLGAIAARIREAGYGSLIELSSVFDPERLADFLCTVPLPSKAIIRRAGSPPCDSVARDYYGL